MGISPPLAGIMLYKYCISHLLTAKKKSSRYPSPGIR